MRVRASALRVQKLILGTLHSLISEVQNKKLNLAPFLLVYLPPSSTPVIVWSNLKFKRESNRHKQI